MQAYLEALLPLVVATCTLTPLNAVDLAVDEVSPWAAPLRLLSIDLPKGVLETHFVLSDKALQRGRYHTVLTHMLLHESHAHLASNMAALLFNGFDVYEAVGMNGLLTIYTVGGALAALDRKTKVIQLSNTLDTDSLAHMMDQFSHRIDDAMRGFVEYLPQELGGFIEKMSEARESRMSMSEPLQRGAGKIARRMASIVSPYLGYLGCSAGVSAVAGANLMISLEHVGKAVANCQFRHSDIFTIGWGLLGAFTKVDYLMYQYTLFRRQGVRNRVDNAGHITGFSIGIGVYLAYRLHGHLKRRKRRLPRPPPPL